MTTDDEQRGRLSAKVERLEADADKVVLKVEAMKAELVAEMKAIKLELSGTAAAIANMRAIVTAVSIIAAAVWANPKQLITALRSIFP